MYKKNIAFWEEEIHQAEHFIKLQLKDKKLVNVSDEYKRIIQELKDMKMELKRLEKLQEKYECSATWSHTPFDTSDVFTTVEVLMDIINL